jgi:hypothetical protein
MNVAGFEHRSRLVFPVLGRQSPLNSLLAVAEDFGVISVHSKWPFVGFKFVLTNSFEPTLTGISSFFFVIDRISALDDGLVQATASS